MGQANNTNRHAELDEKKSRAAGRRNEEARKEILDAMTGQFAKGKTGGADGRGATAQSGNPRNRSGRES